MNTKLLHDTLAGSMEGSIAFPQVVKALSAEGVESYCADLVRREATFYATDGETHVVPMDFEPCPIAQEFSSAELLAAIRASQACEQTYREFLARAMSAGTTHYQVFLAGCKVIYFGRKGEFHIEEFPVVKS